MVGTQNGNDTYLTHRVRSQRVSGDDTEVASATLHSLPQVRVRRVVRGDDGAVGEDNLELDHVVRSPAMFCRHEAQAT